jgi:hypothetical protein
MSKNTPSRKQKKSHNKDVPSKTFYYNKPCMCCGKKLVRVSSTDRYLSTREERMRIFIEVYECQSRKCKLYKQKVKAPEFNTLIFPGLSYGIDVVAEIGVLRFKEHKTISEIHGILTKNYSHIEITERHLQNIVNKIMYVMESTSLSPKMMKEKLIKKNKGIKGLVLSVDGLEPERGNEILYIVRELQTGEILFAKFLEFSDESTMMKEIYKPIKELSKAMGFPVLGLVVDKQSVLTTAFKKLFLNIPVQHCQSHFLKALRKPIQEQSSRIAKEIKKTSNSGNRKRD